MISVFKLELVLTLLFISGVVIGYILRGVMLNE